MYAFSALTLLVGAWASGRASGV